MRGFHVRGDVIEMDGVVVARIAPGLVYSERARFKDTLEAFDFEENDDDQLSDDEVDDRLFVQIKAMAAKRAEAGMITLGDLDVILEKLK